MDIITWLTDIVQCDFSTDLFLIVPLPNTTIR